MWTRPAESPGRPLERHGNVSPREMTVHGAGPAHAPGQNPAYRPAHSPSRGGAPARLPGASALVVERERRRADDPRVVAVDGRHDGRLEVEQWQELIGVFGDSVVDDEQVRVEEELEVRVVVL